jgi:hypothetical protein
MVQRSPQYLKVITKPEKSLLITEQERYLSDGELVMFIFFDFAVILDFMTKGWSFQNLTSFGTFYNAVRCVLSAGDKIIIGVAIHWA